MDISSMLEVQVKEETDVKENVTPGKKDHHTSSTTSTVAPPISQEENNFYKLMFGNDIASVRFHRIHCTACDTHIGSAPSQAFNMYEHPVLRTLLCESCHEFYGDGTFEQGDDATDMFCRWCANGGNLYCCSYCSNTFCYRCIRRNFTALVRKKIEADEKWKCFVCNPRDLYSMRAVCWALLQHVQTVTRILKNDKKMSAEEIEEKMNLDESPCCPRRSKRKTRRRLESNSDEEDDTYMPKVNGAPELPKRKIKKLKRQITYTSPNGNVTRQIQSYTNPIPIRPRPIGMLSNQSVSQTEPVQSRIEHDQPVSTSENIIFTSSNMINSNSLPSNVQLHSPPPLYHATFMNTMGSSTYIRAPVTMNSSSHKIIFPPPPPSAPPQPQPKSTSYQPQPQPQSISYQSSRPLQSSLNTMVTIPRSTRGKRPPRFLLPKQKESNVTLTPNIIELDSDSDDEPRVVDRQSASTVKDGEGVNVADTSFSKVVPVALTWNSDDDDVREEQSLKEQPLIEMCATVQRGAVSFSETMEPHCREFDKLLNDMKEKMNNLFDVDDAISDIECVAQQKIKQYYRNMRNAVFELTHINDRTMRDYNKWMRSRKKISETDAPPSADEDASASREDVNISLDMICVNESDTEADCEIPKDTIKKPSDIVQSNSIVKNLLVKKDVVHRGVGDDSVRLSADKTTQVYDVVLRDYEKYISHSVVSRADQDPQTDVVLEPAAPDKNFGKYEEQFIFYLQHIEDHGIELEDTQDLDDSNRLSLQKLIETNSPIISQFLENIGSPVTSVSQSANCEHEKSSRDHVNSMTADDKTDTPVSIADKDDKIIDNADSDTRIQETNVQPDEELLKTQSQKIRKKYATDGEAILATTNDANSDKNVNDANIEVVASVGNEEDCTIIDD